MTNDQRLPFLDGLRGWASVGVLLCHTFQVWLFNPLFAQKNGLSSLNLFIYSTPLGMLFDAQLAVDCFFVVSGVALTYPVLVSRNPGATLQSMARYRYFRLAVPAAASVLFAYVLWSTIGFWNNQAGALSDSSWLAYFYNFTPSIPDAVAYSFWNLFFDFSNPNLNSYNQPLGTLRAELLGSAALFLLLLVERRLRLLIVVATMIYLVGWSTVWNIFFGFFSGYLIAEFMLRGHRPFLGAAIIGIAIAFSVLSYYPAAAYRWNLVPQIIEYIGWPNTKNFLATALVAGFALSLPMRRTISGPISRRLGELSFPLYLVHLPIICSISSWIFVVLAERSMAVAIAAAGLTTVVLSFLVASLFHIFLEQQLLRRIKTIVTAPLPRLTLSLEFLRSR